MEHRQIAQASHQNICLSDIVLEPATEECWLNMLAKIGTTIRCQRGDLTEFLSFGAEKASLDTVTGELIIRTTLGNENLELVVPTGMWRKNIKI